MRQRTAGEYRYGAVITFFDGFAHRQPEARAFFELVPHAPAGYPDHLEMLVGIHVAHRHQRAIFEFQRGIAVGPGLDAHFVSDIGDQMTELRIARIFIGQILDEMRQLIAGVQALEMRSTIDVVFRIHQPMDVEHHNRVHPEFAAAAADFVMAVNCGLTATLVGAVQFR